MKSKSSSFRFALVLSTFALQSLFAADHYTSGLSTWDLSTPGWSPNSGGPYTSAWVNDATAVFEGSNSYASLNASVNSAGVRFHATETILSGSGVLNLTAPTVFVQSGSQATISAGTGLTGVGLTKTGEGTLVVSGSKTLSGPVIIQEGRVRTTQAGNSLGAGAITVQQNGTLELGSGDSISHQTGHVVHIQGGTVTTGNSGGYRNTIYDLQMTGGVLTSQAGNTGDVNGHFSIFNGVTTHASSQTALISAGIVGLQGQNQGTGSNVFHVEAGTTESGVDLRVTSLLKNFNQNTNRLVKNGAGTLELTNNNTFSGGLLINEGRVISSGTNALGAGTVTVKSGAVLQANAQDSLSNALGVIIHLDGGTLTTGNSGAYRSTIANLHLTGGTVTYQAGNAGDGGGHFSIFNHVTSFASGTTSVIDVPMLGLQGQNINNNKTIFNIAQGSTASGVDVLVRAKLIDWAGSGKGIIKEGAGTLELAGANGEITGGLTVNQGRVITSALYTLGSGTITINEGAVLQASAQNSMGTSGAVVHINGGTLTTGNSGAYRNTLGHLQLTGGHLTSQAGNAGDLSGQYSIFHGVTTFASSKTSVIDASILSLQTQNVAAGSTVFDVAKGTTESGVDLRVSSKIINFNNSGPKGIIKRGEGTMELTQSSEFTGSFVIEAGRVISSGPSSTLGVGPMVVKEGGVLEVRTHDGISHASTATVHLDGGLMTTGGSGNFRNTITTLEMTGGTLDALASNQGQNGAHYSIYNNNVKVNASDRESVITSPTRVGLQTANAGSGSTTFDVADGSAENDLRVDGALVDFNGSKGIVKTGQGTMALNGVNAYTGSTQVNQGHLKVNGSIASSSQVTVAQDARLSGTGTVSAIQGAGTIEPGNSPGTLTATSLNFSQGADLKLEFTEKGSALFGANNDVLVLTSNSPFAGSVANQDNVIDLYFLHGVDDLKVGDTFVGGIHTSATSDDFSSIIENAIFNYYVKDNAGTEDYLGETYSLSTGLFAWDVISENGGASLAFTVVPEPSRVLLMILSGLGAVTFRRRKSLVA